MFKHQYNIALILLLLLLVASCGSQSSKLKFNIDLNQVTEDGVSVLYFGYAGCSKECPIALFEMQEALDQNPMISFVFVNLFHRMPENDVHTYMSAFNSQIQTIPYNEQNLGELRKVSAQPAPHPYYEKLGHINHADAFFVLKKTGGAWELTKVIPSGKGQLAIYIKHEYTLI